MLVEEESAARGSDLAAQCWESDSSIAYLVRFVMSNGEDLDARYVVEN